MWLKVDFILILKTQKALEIWNIYGHTKVLKYIWDICGHIMIFGIFMVTPKCESVDSFSSFISCAVPFALNIWAQSVTSLFPNITHKTHGIA